MTTIRAMPPWMFSLDGIFLGFVGGGPNPPKQLHLAVDGEVLAIQIRRELRPLLKAQLHPGDRLRCIGRSQIHGTTGMILLKASQIFKAESHRSAPQDLPWPQQPSPWGQGGDATPYHPSPQGVETELEPSWPTAGPRRKSLFPR